MKATIITLFAFCCAALAQTGDLSPRVQVTSGQIGGFTLVTNLSLAVDASDPAGVTAGDAMMPQLEISNACRGVNRTSLLGSLTLINGDDVAPEFVLLFTSQPITWPATNAPAALVSSEIQSRLLTMVNVAAADWSDLGTNRVAIFEGLNRGLKPATNSVFVYGLATSIGPFTNGINATFTIYQD